MMRQGLLALSAIPLVLATTAAPAAAQSKCTAAKYKEMGKKYASKTKCYAKAVQKNLPVDPNCLLKAEQKFALKWAKAEEKGDCLTVVDEVTGEGIVDFCVNVTVSALGTGMASTTTTTTTTSTTSTTAEPLICFDNMPIPLFNCGVMTAEYADGFGGGTPGSAGEVCGASGTCQPPPATGGDCCQYGSSICLMMIGDSSICNAGLGGTLVPGTVCQASGLCQ